MSVQSEAIRRYFALNDIKNCDVAEAMKISASAVSNLLAGRDGIGRGRAAQLHDIYGFNERFLLTGEGQLLAPDDQTAQPIQVSHNSGHSQNTVNVAPTADVAALKAQVEALKEENLRLWSMIDRMTGK